MAKLKYDRWLDDINELSSYDKNFRNEKIISCYFGKINSLSSGFFGRVDYFLGYITTPKNRDFGFEPGESQYPGTRTCIVIGGKEDSLLLISNYFDFKLRRNIRGRHFEPPKNYSGDVNNNLIDWAKMFNSDLMKEAYGIKDVVIVDTAFAKQFKVQKKVPKPTKRLLRKIEDHLKL